MSVFVVFVDSLSLVMVLNMLNYHSIYSAVAFFYACYVTADTVI